MYINKITNLPIYFHKNKLGDWNMIEDKWIQLPQAKSEIDVYFMEKPIFDIQKLVIKDIVFYLNRENSVTQKMARGNNSLL